MNNRNLISRLLLVLLITGSGLPLFAQRSWFIDGYHGGVWGHYPKGYTNFIIGQLDQYPEWKINLEIEPVTWDSVKKEDPAAYAAWRKLMEHDERIEYVNPAFGQPYFFMGSGESMIRQFSYGIKKLRQHFPGIRFTTYSSEEPCFTSALPQVLRSFGFKYASLKNPNTCWGGYTRAFGGELVNWTGPDGSSILTVPRYATEELVRGSTWQTTAWNSGRTYVQQALQYGIQHPVGMCLQDAGWRNGPWLGRKTDSSAIQYTTWRNYFEKIADPKLSTSWKLSQEDILVSLVWGSQVLQRIAQQVRKAEDKLVFAEKLAAMAAVQHGFAWPGASLDSAWQYLLLAQHHDCWIVPYNGSRGNTWADKVRNWTSATEQICTRISAGAIEAMANNKKTNSPAAFSIFNTAPFKRNELVAIPMEENKNINAVRSGNQLLPVQWAMNEKTGKKELLFKASVLSAGSQDYSFTTLKAAVTGAAAAVQRDGLIILETDLYRLTIDPRSGGAIRSLISKQMQHKEWVDANRSSFNTLKGNFYTSGGQLSKASEAATVTIIEHGPLRVKARISAAIAGHPFEQTITLVQGEPRIDCSLRINWQGNTGIGNAYKQDKGYRAEDYQKAFYDDSQKLLLDLPLNLAAQVVHKNAPFDVTESKLETTAFNTWDSIKNNIILHWVDITDKTGSAGMALFTDHTTAYVHGADHPLALVVQYSGVGLWGRNYILDGPTEISYSLLPHPGKWDQAQLEAERVKLAEPLQFSSAAGNPEQSFIRLSKPGWELSSMTINGKDLLLRFYNAAASDAELTVYLPVPVKKATLVNLDGSVIKGIQTTYTKSGASFTVTAPRFGIRTIRLHNLVK